MQVKRIGFGYVKSLGNYENCKVWLEADLEDWEDPSQSLNLLRNQVAQELDLPDKWHDLKGKFNKQSQALEAIDIALAKSQEKLKKAQEEWGKYAAFLEAHGIDPETLKIDSPYGSLLGNLTKRALRLQEFCTECVQTDNFVGFIQEIQHILKENETPGFVSNEYDGCFDENSHPDPDYYDPYHGPEDSGDDGYPDPYYGDEYNRLHDRVDDDESKNSFF